MILMATIEHGTLGSTKTYTFVWDPAWGEPTDNHLAVATDLLLGQKNFGSDQHLLGAYVRNPRGELLAKYEPKLTHKALKKQRGSRQWGVRAFK